jgi:uncharacterized protein (TIGR00730 family)
LKKNICVFGGSVSGKNLKYKKTAKFIGKIIAENNFNVVFGGGENGIMGAVSQSSIENGATTIGIIPHFLLKKDIQDLAYSKKFNTKLIQTETMHQRKKLMYDKSDGFIVLPGGIGTLDECFEVLTWCQLSQIKNKNIGIINFEGYWDPLINLINHLIKEEFMGSNNLNYFQEIKDIKMLKIFLKGI